MTRVIFFIFLCKLFGDRHGSYDRYHGHCDSRLILQPMKQPAFDIVLYDGTCHLCARSVQFIIQRDPKGHFRFAPLQSDVARQLLQQHSYEIEKVSSVLLFSKGQLHARSDAALLILRHLTGGWRLLSFLKIVPRPLRDFFYRLIARYRYHLFGKRATCLVTLPRWEERFLF